MSARRQGIGTELLEWFEREMGTYGVGEIHAGIANFHALYKPLVDTWRLYDNSGERPVFINSNDLP